MTDRPDSHRPTTCGHRAAAGAALCLLALCAALAAPQQQSEATDEGGDERVYLIHADVLHFDRYKNPDAQILNGNVAFRHKGATLYCDSAYFYEKTNSFEAFSNVKMYQGDTVSLFSDYAFYDGNEMMAEARFNVVLKHVNSTLYTDSLNFDRLYNIGYFFDGGTLVDGTNTLTSDWGEYHADDKHAVFNYDVRLHNERFVLTTDTLHYDTNTSIAHTLGPSDVMSGTSHIYTENGYYDTKLDTAVLFRHSVLTDQGRRLTGDSIYYDNKLRVSEAYGNVVYDDTLNRNMMTCDYYYYNDSTGYGMATRRAVAIDYSQRDSLYMHADTFKVFSFNVNTDSAFREVHAYHRVRAYRVDVQAVCDSLVYNSADSCMTMYRDPIAWSGSQQVLGEVIKVYLKDSNINRVHVIGQALSVEQMNDKVNYNQVSSNEMLAYFRNGEVREAEAKDNVLVVYYPVDESDSSLIGLNYTETTLLRVFIENRRMQRVWMPRADGTLYPMSQIPPQKRYLPTYAWFDYVRPLDKEDIFNWRPKAAGAELKIVKRKSAPLQYLDPLPSNSSLNYSVPDAVDARLGGDSVTVDSLPVGAIGVGDSVPVVPEPVSEIGAASALEAVEPQPPAVGNETSEPAPAATAQGRKDDEEDDR